MNFNDIARFLESNHTAVIAAFRKKGAAHMSIVPCGPYDGGVAFTTPRDRVKLANLRRDPRCSILISKPDWSGYAVVKGTADIRGADNTDAKDLRLALRDVFRACGGGEHSDWEEYDRAMVDDGRVAIIIRPDRIYGMNF